MFERAPLHAFQREVEMSDHDGGRPPQRRLRRAVHQNVQLRLFVDQFSFDVAAGFENPGGLGFRHEQVGLGPGAGFVLETAGFDEPPEQRFIR